MFLNLADEHLQKVDNFTHGNIVFGFGKEGDEKVIEFLINKEIPEIHSSSHSFEENSKDIFLILGVVLRKYLEFPGAQHVRYSYPPQPQESNLLSFSLSGESKNSPPNIHCSAVITVDTSGYVVNSSFEGNLPKSQIEKINYYLSRLSNLAPYKQEDEMSLSNITINILTYTDTVKNGDDAGVIDFTYDAVDASFEENAHHYSNTPGNPTAKVQIEAKFPGGSLVWQKYLERNLKANIAIDNGAPVGVYTVLVSFLVDESGNVSEVQALNNPGYGTAEEAVRVIKKGPAWVPAVNNGRNVTYRQKQSISFVVSAN